MVFGTYKVSEMAFATASSVVPERPANGEQGQEAEADVPGVVECKRKMQLELLVFFQSCRPV